MSYEDLMMIENFSEDEQTLTYTKKKTKDIRTIKTLKKANLLKAQVDELRKFSIDGMSSILKTIGGIDKSNRQFMFKQFDKYEENSLHKQAPILQYKIKQLE
jgi:hypothetical protein